jgi:hypothetical protein
MNKKNRGHGAARRADEKTRSKPTAAHGRARRPVHGGGILARVGQRRRELTSTLEHVRAAPPSDGRRIEALEDSVNSLDGLLGAPPEALAEAQTDLSEVTASELSRWLEGTRYLAESAAPAARSIGRRRGDHRRHAEL